MPTEGTKKRIAIQAELLKLCATYCLTQALDSVGVDFVAADSVVSGFVALDSVVVDFAVWGLGASHRKTIAPTKLCPLRQAEVRFPTGPKVFGCTPR